MRTVYSVHCANCGEKATSKQNKDVMIYRCVHCHLDICYIKRRLVPEEKHD